MRGRLRPRPGLPAKRGIRMTRLPAVPADRKPAAGVPACPENTPPENAASEPAHRERPARTPAPLGPPQFRLRTMFLGLTALCAVFAVMHFVSLQASLVLLMAIGLVAAHVIGNALGTRLRDRADQQPADSPSGALPPRGSPQVAMPASQLTEHRRLPTLSLIVAAVGAVAGGVAGGGADRRGGLGGVDSGRGGAGHRIVRGAGGVCRIPGKQLLSGGPRRLAQSAGRPDEQTAPALTFSCPYCTPTHSHTELIDSEISNGPLIRLKRPHFRGFRWSPLAHWLDRTQ